MFHPIHVTVSNIEFKTDTRLMSLSTKIYLDDFEKAIFNDKSIFLNLGKNNEIKDSNEIIINYIRDNFNISINKTNFNKNKIKLIRREIVEDAIWLYFTYPITKKISSINIKNTLLNNVYSDMSNLVIIKFNEKEFGYTLNRTNSNFTINASK